MAMAWVRWSGGMEAEENAHDDENDTHMIDIIGRVVDMV
jgi:hypothetical protein